MEAVVEAEMEAGVKTEMLVEGACIVAHGEVAEILHDLVAHWQAVDPVFVSTGMAFV